MVHEGLSEMTSLNFLKDLMVDKNIRKHLDIIAD